MALPLIHVAHARNAQLELHGAVLSLQDGAEYRDEVGLLRALATRLRKLKNKSGGAAQLLSLRAHDSDGDGVNDIIGDDCRRLVNQPITSYHFVDNDGNPAGGLTTSIGLWLEWQNGPLGRGASRVEPDGTFVETVIAAAVDRLAYYQSSRFSCRENALAITKLEEALHWLNHRTAAREARGVEGTHTV